MRALTVLPKFPSPPPLALLVTFLFYTSIFNGHLAVFAIYVCMYIYLFTSTHFQCSCLGNPMVKGAWQAIVHGITKSQMQLSMHTYHYAVFTYMLYLYTYDIFIDGPVFLNILQTSLEKNSCHFSLSYPR